MGAIKIEGNNLAEDFLKLYKDYDQGMMSESGNLVGGLTEKEYQVLKKEYAPAALDLLIDAVAKGQDDFMSAAEFSTYNGDEVVTANTARYAITNVQDFQFAYTGFALDALNNQATKADKRAHLFSQLGVTMASTGFLSAVRDNKAESNDIIGKLTNLLAYDADYPEAVNLLTKLADLALDPMMLIVSDDSQDEKLRSRALLVAVNIVTNLSKQGDSAVDVYMHAFDAALAEKISFDKYVDADLWQTACEKLVKSALKLEAATFTSNEGEFKKIMPAMLRVVIADASLDGYSEDTYVSSFIHLGARTTASSMTVLLGYPDNEPATVVNLAIKVLHGFAAFAVANQGSDQSAAIAIKNAARGEDETVQYTDADHTIPANVFTDLRRVDDYDEKRKRFHAAKIIAANLGENYDSYINDTLVGAFKWGLLNDGKVLSAIEALYALKDKTGFSLTTGDKAIFEQVHWQVLEKQKTNTALPVGSKMTYGQMATELLVYRP